MGFRTGRRNDSGLRGPQKGHCGRNGNMKAKKLLIWTLLFSLGVAVPLYLQFLFNQAGKLALIPHGFAVGYGFFLASALWNLLKKPMDKQSCRYIRRETHYNGSNRREV